MTGAVISLCSFLSETKTINTFDYFLVSLQLHTTLFTIEMAAKLETIYKIKLDRKFKHHYVRHAIRSSASKLIHLPRTGEHFLELFIYFLNFFLHFFNLTFLHLCSLLLVCSAIIDDDAIWSGSQLFSSTPRS